MGGLRKHMPVTFWTMTAAVFTIAGFPPLAAFFSKDAILYEAFLHGTFGMSALVCRTLDGSFDIVLHVPAVVHDLHGRIAQP